MDEQADPGLGRDGWEQRWRQALATHGDAVAAMPPSRYLLEVLDDLRPGRALDAGSGHGAETLRLAAAGWVVTAVDFSRAALDHARGTAESLGDDLADRITWVEGDLGTWTPAEGTFDLVLCLYVHSAGPVVEQVRRLAAGVAPGGTLLLVGHQPVDPETGEPTPAAGQVQVSVDDARAALADGWELLVAHERRRPQAGSGVDAVVRAVRRA